MNKFDEEWDGDRVADFPLDYRKALDKKLQDEIEEEKEYELWKRNLYQPK